MATTKLKEDVFTALRKLLAPIIKIMLCNGVTYKELCAICKDIYVCTAATQFGVKGRPTNISRIALLTGLDRKEVKRIRDLSQKNRMPNPNTLKQDRIARLLSAWHLDVEFLDENGLPNILPIEGAEGSFHTLIKRYGGDLPPHAILKELLRTGVIEELIEARVKVLKRNYFPIPTDTEALLRAGSVINELAETLFHNLYAEHANKIPRFERRASNHFVHPKYQKAFKAFLDKEGQAFLERVDDWLSAREIATDASLHPTPLYLGVGVYSIHKSPDIQED